jgi:hypothetical protein
VKIESNRYALPRTRKRGSTRSYDRDTLRSPDRRRKRKSCTKAVLKRRLRAHLINAIAQMHVVNRIDIIPEKKAHLVQAVSHLEAVLEEKAGSHLLRQQLALCREFLREIERGASDCRSEHVGIVIDAG